MKKKLILNQLSLNSRQNSGTGKFNSQIIFALVFALVFEFAGINIAYAQNANSSKADPLNNAANVSLNNAASGVAPPTSNDPAASKSNLNSSGKNPPKINGAAKNSALNGALNSPTQNSVNTAKSSSANGTSKTNSFGGSTNSSLTAGANIPSVNTATATVPATPAVEAVSASTAPSAPAPQAQPQDPERASFEEKVAEDVKKKLLSDLNRYCLEYCSILSISGNGEEAFETANADIGFEGVNGAAAQRKFKARGISAEILIDNRFGTHNIERLQQLFVKLAERYPHSTELRWTKITFPDSGLTTRSEAQVRADFNGQVKSQLERIINDYCPRDCKLNEVEVNVARATMDEVQDGRTSRFLFARDGKGALFVRGVQATLSLNQLIEAPRKSRIQNLMRDHLLPFGTVSLTVSEIPFPRGAEEVQKDLDESRADPYGLERLGRMLKVFKEYSSTKEIIRERDSSQSNNTQMSEKLQSAMERAEKISNSSSTENSKHSSAEIKSQKESSNNSEKNSELNNSTNSLENSTQGGASFWTTNMMLIVGGTLLALLVVGAVGLRFVLTGKRMQAVIHEGMGGAPAGGNQGYSMPNMGHGNSQQGDYSGNIAQISNSYASEDLRQKMQLQSLRDELIQIFITQPKVARDVFGRIIREDGVEHAAKLVVIFGEMIVFELLGDADLKQDISTLAEYVHVNAPEVPSEDQFELLRHLKLKMTAGKMRLMANKSLDIFDFLKARSPRQIFELIVEESARSQSIVLTQLSTDKRRLVFELFEGQSKVELLRELCTSDTVARDYLHNVAEALKRKAQSKSDFNGENVHGTDVLLDLLDRADLNEQRNLMGDLDLTNPEISRVVRSRLVTVETLPFLRDGLLLEIFLSMDTNTMATFLAGTREHIRNLILAKAPPDVAQDWMETLENIRGVDPEALKLADMQVITKARSFASSGMINLIEINESLYPKMQSETLGEGENQQRNRRVFKISNPLVA